MTWHSAYAGVIGFVCLSAFGPLAIAGGEPKELQVHSTNSFVTDPFEPALNWRFSDDAEALIFDRFGPPIRKEIRQASSSNPSFDEARTVLLYPDIQFILVGQAGSKRNRIREIRIFGPSIALKHTIRTGMYPSELRRALELTRDLSTCPSPIRIRADYEEYDAENDFSEKTHVVFEAHVGLGTIQFMRWEFLQD